MNSIEIKNLPSLSSISGNEDLIISTSEGKVRRVKTNLIGGSISTLHLNSMTELNRVDLSDGMYNIDGAISGALIIVNSHNNGVLDAVLQTYIDAKDIYTREITIALNQVYPAWKTKSVTIGSLYAADMFNIVDTNGFNATTPIWTDAYKFLLIPGSYGVYFTSAPIPLLEPTQKNFILQIDYASYKNSGSNANIDFTHTLINPENGKSYIRKVYHTSTGIACTQFNAILPSVATTPIQGLNGTDTEFIYKISNTVSGIYAPATAQSDLYIPSGWSAELNNVSESLPYAFMSKRKRDKNGVWGLFSAPALIGRYAKDGINGINGVTGHDGDNGKDGPGVEFVFKRTTSYAPPSTPSPSNNVDDYVPTGWTDDPAGVDNTYQYEWVSKRKKSIPEGLTVASWGNFSPPALWAKYALAGAEPGTPGEPGVDGKDIQFVYKLTNSTKQIPAPASPAGDKFTSGNGWEDNMLSVTPQNRYLWCARRYKAASVWSEFTTPVIWAVYSLDGQNGEDGKSFEYIFALTSSFVAPQIAEADKHRPSTDDFVPGPYNGATWTDNPTGVSSNFQYEWVAYRIKSNGSWGYFSNPALWSKWSTDGKNGINAVHASLSREIVNISCMADGRPRTGQVPTDIYIHTFDGNLPAAATITAVPDIDTTLCNVTPTSNVGVYKLTITGVVANNDVIRLAIEIFSTQLGRHVAITKTVNIFKTMDGYAGPSVIARGAYIESETYHGNYARVDAVSITNLGATQWYIARTTAGDFTNKSPLDETNGKWDIMPSFEMIATGTLLAENANVGEFIFNAGKLKSQYPTENQAQNLNGGKNLELDGTNGTVEFNSALGDIHINKDGIFLNDLNGTNSVSIFNGDIPELNEYNEFAIGNEVTTSISPTSLGGGSFVGTKQVSIPNSTFTCPNKINKVIIYINTLITITAQQGSVLPVYQIVNSQTGEILLHHNGRQYVLEDHGTYSLCAIDGHATFYNVPEGTYMIKLLLVHSYGSTFTYSALNVSASNIKYQNISLGTAIGNDGIAFASGAKDYVLIKKDENGKLALTIGGNVNIYSGNGTINIGEPNSMINITGHVRINGALVNSI